MNEKEIAELRRRYRADRSNITRVRGCFVNEKKEIISEFEQGLGLMNEEEAELLRDLTECDLECLGEIPLNRDQRVAMLSRLVEYYSIHLDAIRSVRSIEILQEVF